MSLIEDELQMDFVWLLMGNKNKMTPYKKKTVNILKYHIKRSNHRLAFNNKSPNLS